MISGITLSCSEYTVCEPGNATAGTKTLRWTLPSLVDGLAVRHFIHWKSTDEEATVGYALTYTGVEGLSVSYGAGEVGGKTDGSQVLM